MANKQKKVIEEMSEQNWFALEEYVECYKKLRFNLMLKHGIPILYLILIGFGAFLQVHWYFILTISAALSFIYFRNIPKINHTLKCAEMAILFMEIEFGFSKVEDNIELTDEIKKVIN
jgi:hypothetical protein